MLLPLVGLALAVPPASAQTAVEAGPSVEAETAVEAETFRDDPNIFIYTKETRDHPNCMGASRSKGRDVTLVNLGPECERAKWQIWELHHVRTHSNGTKLYQIRFPWAAPDLCLSIEGVEGGQSSYGDDAQVEGCETKDDAIWWVEESAGAGDQVNIRRYIPGHTDRCLAPDMSDRYTPSRTVQLEGCKSSNETTWHFMSAP